MARRLVVRNPARLLWTLFVLILIFAGLLAWRARPQYPPSFSEDGTATSSLSPVTPQPTQAPIETEAARKKRIAEEIAQIRAVRKALAAEDETALAKLLDEGLPAALLVPDDPEQVTRQTSLIYMAADAGRVDLVRLLLDRGADAQQLNFPTMVTPLFCAVENRDLELARLLLKHGANPYWEAKQGVSAIGRALGNDEMLKLLVTESKYEPESNPSHPPLPEAIERGRESAARILIEAGVGVQGENWEGDTPLHLAAERNMTDICELLIRKGAKVNEPDREGRTALDRANARKAYGAARLLKKHGGRTAYSGRANRTSR
ncbi:MAG: ankyrin repeat domain-containing protein [Armatimonadetes bacterium]|nr:ankyrin repeat domain-containing protein [Armatimonadota bacterium]